MFVCYWKHDRRGTGFPDTRLAVGQSGQANPPLPWPGITVIFNGFVLALFALIVGSIVLRVSLAPGSLPLLAIAIAVSAYACTGLGLVTPTLALQSARDCSPRQFVFGTLMAFWRRQHRVECTSGLDGNGGQVATAHTWDRSIA